MTLPPSSAIVAVRRLSNGQKIIGANRFACLRRQMLPGSMVSERSLPRSLPILLTLPNCSKKRDPEEAQSVVDPAIGIMIDAVHHYGGYVAQSTGDGVFALFGAPIAYEDHPQRALFAALRMQNGIKDFSQGLTARGEHSIAIRIGVNWGEVVLRNIKTGEDSAEYTPIGHVINLASRLQTIASPGSIVIGSDVQKLIDGFFATKPLGRVPIRGMSDLVETFEVTGLGPIRTRLQKGVGQGLSKFVGRQSEMSSIRQAAALARSGHGQILALLGEPGVGKSRILVGIQNRFEIRVGHPGGLLVLIREKCSFPAYNRPALAVFRNHAGPRCCPATRARE